MITTSYSFDAVPYNPTGNGQPTFHHLAEHAQEVFYRFRCHPDPALEYINPAITTVAGFSPTECFHIPDFFHHLIHTDDLPLWEQVLQGKAVEQPLRIRWVHRSGAVLWVEQYAVRSSHSPLDPVYIDGMVRHMGPPPTCVIEGSLTQPPHPLHLKTVSAILGQQALAMSGADRIAIFCQNADQEFTHLWSKGLSQAYLGYVTVQQHPMPEHFLLGGHEARERDPEGLLPDSFTGLCLLPDMHRLDDRSQAGLLQARSLAEEEGFQALALSPIVYAQRIIAILGCYYNEPHHWSFGEIENLKRFSQQAALTMENARLYEELEGTYLQMVMTLAQAVALRDRYTAEHSQRLADWAEATAARLALSQEDIQNIRWAALLHDIGKIGVPDAILRKDGPLTQEEWSIMRQHPTLGAEILTPIKKFRPVRHIIRHHQEKYDGTGYPDGLTGENIPLASRILTVVDAYGAMTDDRIYRKARTRSEAVAELWRCAGTHFDRQIVETFSRLIGD